MREKAQTWKLSVGAILVAVLLTVAQIMVLMALQVNEAAALPDGSRNVTVVDIMQLAARWGEAASWPDDSDGDGVITTADIQWLASLWRSLPPASEEPVLGWATGPEGVLLRWRWSQSARPPSGFQVYRDGSPLARVQRVTDEAEAATILGSHWPWLQTTYSVTTIAELHTFLDDNSLAELWLADQRYPVALIRGLGYLDDTAAEGSEHTYRVTALLPGGELELGEVSISHKGITRLDAPTGLTTVQVVSDTLRGSADWARAQKNRKADSKVFLRWDLPGGSGTPSPTWVTSYDVFRATVPTGPYDRITIRDGADEPVVPMADHDPVPPVEDDPYASIPYEHHDYYYADADPALQACEKYYYRVAPRDLLGRPRDWGDPTQRDQLSDHVEAVPPDTMPPTAPLSVTATADYFTGEISVTWHAVTDAVRYHVYRSTEAGAAWPGVSECVTCTTWITMTTTASTSWVDASAAYEQRYWYVVRAEDAPCAGDPPNLSAPSEPVTAILHDRVPPGKPSVQREESQVMVAGDGDTAEILLFCRFDNGPELLVAQKRTRDLDYDLSRFYTPAKPIKAECRAVAVDDHGNRSEPSAWVPDIRLAPSSVPDPSPPILLEISTAEGGDYGWTANLTWDALDAPCLAGFRVYRQEVGDPETRIADESTLGPNADSYADRSVRWGAVYTYTVAAYQARDICGSEKEVRSLPMLYRVTRPLALPGRDVNTLDWVSHSYDSQGTHLSWRTGQRPQQSIVFRSLRADQGYVAITPPIAGSSYLDTNARHTGYWYMVVELDSVTGEPFAATSAWSASVLAAAEATTPNVVTTSVVPAAEAATAIIAAPPPPLPDVLHFGDGFELHVSTYYGGSTMSDLNGEGELYLYPGGSLSPVSLVFTHLKATWQDSTAVVTDGSVTVPGTALPIELTPAGGFRYEVTALTVDPVGGTGDVTLYLPDSIRYRWLSGPLEMLDDHVDLSAATIHPALTFQRDMSYNLACDFRTASYFRLEDLPWRVIPTSIATFTQDNIAFDSACALYYERYTGTRPGPDDPDANDGLLRAQYNSGDARIDPSGLSGTFSTQDTVNYTVPAPYGFHLTLDSPTVELDGGLIVGGKARASNSRVSFAYFQHVARTNPFDQPSPADEPEGTWTGDLSDIDIGPGGSIYAVATQVGGVSDVSWLNGGFVLHDQVYELYIPPLQSTRAPWEDAVRPATEHVWADGTTVEPGLNRRTAAGESADLAWNDCSTSGPVAFTEGVRADLYLRRPGLSDLLEADIPPGSPVNAELDGYQARLLAFRLVFFDNTLYDRDIAGAFHLPGPSNVDIPFTDANLDENACISSASVSEETIEPVYWQVGMHPTALEFRPPDPDPTTAGERGLWLIGDVDVPHLSLSGSVTATIPLETAFKPNGDFYAMTAQYDEVNYTVDGFSYLLSSIRLSNWESGEDPGWNTDANANDPPGCCVVHGFVELNGNLVTPYFGTLVGTSSGEPPSLFVLGWDRYVGFSERPQANRSWAERTHIDYGFDLTYAQHHTNPTAIFAGFGESVALRVLTLDHGVVITPGTTEMFLGMASGSAVLKAIAETTVAEDMSWEEFATGGWVDVVRQKLSIPETYIEVLGQFFVHYNDIAEEINDRVAEYGPEWLHGTFELPVGGQSMENIGSFLVNLNDMRGEVEFDAVMEGGRIVDYDLAALRVHTWFEVGDYVKAKSIEFEMNRDGDYILVGKGITSSMLEYDNLKIDFAVAINVDDPSVEAGLMLHNLGADPVTFKNIGAALGVGSDILYLGALADATFNNITVGGAFLFGKINPDSIVLKSMGFSDLLDNLGATGLEEGAILAGFYIRVYGDVPIYNYSCLFRISVGAEVAVWYFAEVDHGGAEAYGGRLRGYAYGKLLCIVHFRGDLTLAIYHRADREGASMMGQFWIAGGIGFCDPSSWNAWDDRWWDDDWCWTCGAMIQADYNDTVPDDWEWDYDADYE